MELYIYMYYYVFVPICSMYVIFTHIYQTYKPNVGTYSIHGAYGYIFLVSHVFSKPTTSFTKNSITFNDLQSYLVGGFNPSEKYY